MSSLRKVTLYSDGGARGNPGPAAIGVLICDESGAELQDHQEVIGNTTNNVAEYRAVLAGLDLAKKLGAREVHCFVDSELVAKQMSGEYRVKTPHIQELFMKVLEKRKNFERVQFTHVPRTHEKIRHVDRLVNQALDFAGH